MMILRFKRNFNEGDILTQVEDNTDTAVVLFNNCDGPNKYLIRKDITGELIFIGDGLYYKELKITGTVIKRKETLLNFMLDKPRLTMRISSLVDSRIEEIIHNAQVLESTLEKHVRIKYGGVIKNVNILKIREVTED